MSPSRLLSLDVSTSTGWALFVDGKLERSGLLPKVTITDFNVNKDPQKSPAYPYNIITAAEKVVDQIDELISDVGGVSALVVENTNKGKNRNTQRALEFIHFALLKRIQDRLPMTYMDTSEWRKAVGMWMSKEDKKANATLSKAKKAAEAAGTKVNKKALGIKGAVNKKHLAVRMANELYSLTLIQKDNDTADAILMGRAFTIQHPCSL